MPESAAIGDGYMVTVEGEIEGQQTANVFHFRCAAADSDVELHLILALAECFITHLLPVFSSAWKITGLRWKRVYPTLGPEFFTVPAGTLVAAGSENALPSYCSVVISKRTALGGRSRRGRFYLPGIPEDATQGSSLDTADPFWAGLIAFVACVVGKFVQSGELGSDQWRMAVYSRTIGGDTFPLGETGFETVTQLVAHAALGTTRSRKVGRGS